MIFPITTPLFPLSDMGSVPTPDPDPDRGGRGSGTAENRGGGACPGFSVRPSTLFLEALAARCPQLFRPPNRAVPTARRSAVTHAPPIAAGGAARTAQSSAAVSQGVSRPRFGLDMMASAGAGAPWAEVTRPLVAASSHTRRTAWGQVSASLAMSGRLVPRASGRCAHKQLLDPDRGAPSPPGCRVVAQHDKNRNADRNARPTALPPRQASPWVPLRRAP